MHAIWKKWSPPYQYLIGHRGAAALAPENTLASFTKAHQLGLNWVEFDIRPCATGEWLVIHDETLARTTTGQGRVSDTPLERIKLMDAGSWFSDQFENERIPTLSEAIQHICKLGMQINIEIKPIYYNRTGLNGDFNLRKKNIILSFLNELDRVYPKNNNPPLISSFDIDILRQIASENSRLPLSYLNDIYSEQAIQLCKNHRFFSLNCKYQSLPKNFKANGEIPILAYTVNDPNHIQALIDCGITAIYSDLPFL